MTTDILETILREKMVLEKWSEQVEELEQSENSDHQSELYKTLKESIQKKMQQIDDLEFEALENQIAFEESQQKTVSSSSSSPHSQSDYKSAISFPSEDSSDKSDEKMVEETKTIINRASWQPVYQLPLFVESATPRKLSPYDNSNDARAFSFTNREEKDRVGTLTYKYKSIERPSSVSSSLEPYNQAGNENYRLQFTRNANQSSSVRSRSSFQKRNNSRPLTRYLPTPNDPEFNLKSYIERCGHNLTVVENVIKLDAHSCYGHLLKLSGKHLKLWKKKSFIFDRNRRILAYYTSSTSTKMKGMISFDQIMNVHAISGCPSKFGSIISNDAHHMFSIQLIDNFNRGRRFKEELKLSAQSAECQRVWMDVIFTGAEGYLKTLNDNRAQILRENNESMDF